MPSITLSSVSFSYTSAHDVLVDVDLDLGPGWHGLVGPNGAGKTTLLALISGDLVPSRGVLSSPQPVVRASQIVDRPSHDVAALAASHQPEAYALRGRLRIDPDDLGRWDSLSPGERRRWQIGAALSVEPAVLLLDEPTNHLDRAATEDLVGLFEAFRGIGVLVSHDRRLLDHLTSTTIRVEGGRVTSWRAPYSVARAEWESEDRRRQAERDAVTDEVRRLRRRLEAAQRDADERNAKWKRSQRYARPGDHDATSTARTVKHRSGQKASGRRIGGLREELGRSDARRRSLETERDHRGSIRFDGEPAPRPVLLTFGGDLTVPGRVLARDLDVTLMRSTRMRLAGANGAGKSTLLRALADRWDLDPDRLLHLPQDFTAREAAERLDAVKRRTADELGWTMQLFARLGGRPDDVLASALPSPGELRKLVIADALARAVWCVLADEPTNHLDLDTVQRLEEALMAYRGALVVVSHDDDFARVVTEETITLGDDI